MPRKSKEESIVSRIRDQAVNSGDFHNSKLILHKARRNTVKKQRFWNNNNNIGKKLNLAKIEEKPVNNKR